MNRSFIVFASAVFLSFLMKMEAASAATVYECQPVQVRLARVLPAEHGRLTVFSLTNLGDAPVYFPLSHSGELMRLHELHPSAYILSTRESEIERWRDNITLGAYDVWKGVLILQPGQAEDIGVPVDLAAIDRYKPDSMFKLEMYGIPTTCKVQSPSFFYRELEELMFRKF